MIDPIQNPKQNDDKDWQLDALLDSLLQSYSAAEPRPGFETRLKAVIGEQAARPRRVNWLVLAASAAALALFGWLMIANPHKANHNVAGPAIAHDSAAGPKHPADKIVIHVTAPAQNRLAQHAATVRSEKANRLVLQMVASTQAGGNVVFEQEKLYLSPEKPPETQPEAAAAPEAETPAPAVSIKAIGVASMESNAPIEIKDIGSPKSSTEKGSL